MREFRVYDKRAKSYNYDREFILNSSGELMELCSNHDGTWEYHFADTDRFVIEQYTGLKDKNGKEIYEGDVIRWSDDYDENGYIDFSDGCFLVNWSINSERINCDMVDDLEVIGNIHENADLLGEKE